MKLLNEILGTKYPIIQGGMANIATGEFAAACSNAGALGIIGAGGMNADTLRENIRRCKQLTDKPFGVNIMLMHPQADEFAQIVVEEGVQVVTTGAGNPGKYVPMWKAAGIKVIPVVAAAVLYHLSKSRDFSDTRILRALATAGLVGNIVKTNASISGAEVGCQGEVGVACAMASAAANQLFGGSPAQIEYAAEMGLEHHLGMTCDPVCGLVQIPCIERNAYAAARALDANLYSSFTDGMHRVSFDKVVAVMKETGNDLPSLYKETSEGGLAKDYKPM